MHICIVEMTVSNYGAGAIGRSKIGSKSNEVMTSIGTNWSHKKVIVNHLFVQSSSVGSSMHAGSTASRHPIAIFSDHCPVGCGRGRRDVLRICISIIAVVASIILCMQLLKKCSEEIGLNQGPVVGRVAKEMQVTPAEDNLLRHFRTD